MRSTQLASCLFLPLFLMARTAPAVPAQDAPPNANSQQKQGSKGAKPKLDRTGKVRTGEASYYGRKFYGKKMADGKAMKPEGNNAASKTLPLGTKAKVTNLETGKSDVVVITDRGPYVKGRIIDVSPKTAKDLDFKHEGVTDVKVKPLELPKQEKASAEQPSSKKKEPARTQSPAR